jgi:hypothetical protein
VKPVFIHHANIVFGVSIGTLVAYIENSTNITARGNPDFTVEEYDSFGIPESRRLKESAYTKPSSENGERVFILVCNSLTREAQNSLLKLLEEPCSDTFFYFLLPSADMLLDTLRSRMQVLVLPNSVKSEYMDNGFAEKFLVGTSAERSVMIQKMIREKDKSLAKDCVGGLISALHGRNKSEEFYALSELQKAYSYLGDRSSSIKLLLEHLAVVLPRVS